jgi:hypothetical protein
LHVGLPHILGQLLLSSRQLSMVFGCTPCPWCAPIRRNPLGWGLGNMEEILLPPIGQSVCWSNVRQGMPWHRDGSGEVPHPVANKTAHHSQTEHEDQAW